MFTNSILMLQGMPGSGALFRNHGWWRMQAQRRPFCVGEMLLGRKKNGHPQRMAIWKKSITVNSVVDW
jgi:hypothetical protein